MRRRACASTSQRAVKRFAGCREAPALSKREDGFSRRGLFPFCATRKTSEKGGGRSPRKRRTLNSYYIARDFSSDVARNAPPLARGLRAYFFEGGVRGEGPPSATLHALMRVAASDSGRPGPELIWKRGVCSPFSREAKVRIPRKQAFSSAIPSVARRAFF